MVWKATINPRVLTFFQRSSVPEFARDTPSYDEDCEEKVFIKALNCDLPAMRACFEARNIYLKHYELCFDAVLHGRPIYVNFKLDTFNFMDMAALEIFNATKGCNAEYPDVSCGCVTAAMDPEPDHELLFIKVEKLMFGFTARPVGNLLELMAECVGIWSVKFLNITEEGEEETEPRLLKNARTFIRKHRKAIVANTSAQKPGYEKMKALQVEVIGRGKYLDLVEGFIEDVINVRKGEGIKRIRV